MPAAKTSNGGQHIRQDFTKPFPVLHSAVLLLRKPVPADAACFFALRTDKNYSRLAYILRYNSVKQAEEYLARIEQSMQEGAAILWSIADPENVVFFGSICLCNLLWEEKQGETCYDLLPAFGGNGYMQEACRRCCDMPLHGCISGASQPRRFIPKTASR